ncbi:filamentous hemagglutinin family protein [Pseudomonas sp. TE3786]
MDVRSPFFQNIACILAGVMFLNPIVSTAAELSVDAAAGGNTQLGNAQNGVPVVNIATPNGSGLSHNKFTDYNVGQQGLILNNGTAAFNETQLGGVILGNSNLNGRAATLILNEVTGGNQSQLKGYTEVAGQGAHVVVANPHGISCDGCGFINTPRATLTTGTPVLDGGRLDHFDVNGGEINIEGAGLNASNISQFDLITRSAKLNAELQAQRLNIIAGRNQVDAATLAATAKAADGSSKPLLAIDSSALGGMYAGAIRLVGTEAGVGVKLAADMAASGGDINIDANGKLTVTRVASAGNVQANAKQIELTDTLYASNTAGFTAEQIDIASSLASGANLTLNGGVINNNGSIEAGVKTDGSGNSAALLHLQGGTLNNAGSISSQGNLNTDLQQLNNQGKKVLAVGDATVKAANIDNRGGQLVAQKTLSVTADNLNNSAGTVASNKALSLTLAATLNNSADGLLLSKADGLTLNAHTLNNQGGTVQADSGALTVTTTGSVTNDSGRIAASQGQQTITAGAISNQAGSLLASSTLKVDAASLNNQSGTLGATQIDLALSGHLNNDNGLLESTTTLQLTADSLSNNGGKLRALGSSGESQFVLGGLFNNDGGLVEIGNSKLSLTSASLSNQRGSVRHLGNQFALALADVGIAGGSFVTHGELSLDVANWTNTSQLQADKISLKVGTFTQSATGKLLSAQGITATGDTWLNDGSIETDGDLKLTLTGAYRGNGALLSQGDLSVVAASVDTGVDAQWKAGGAADFSIGGNLINRGKISAAQSLLARADRLENYGTLGAATSLRIESNSLRNDGGLIFSGNDMALRTDSFTNRLATVYSLGALSIAKNDQDEAATLVENRSGTLESSGDLSIHATTVNNIRDVLSTTQSKYSARIAELPCSRYYGAGDCDGKRNGVWEIEEFDRLAVSADSTAASFLTAGGKLDVRGTTLTNQSSAISAGSDLTVRVANLQNTAIEPGEVRTYRVFRSERTENIGSWQREAEQFTAAYWNKSSVDSNSLTAALNHFIGRTEKETESFRSITATPSGDLSYSGIIQTAGAVNITAQAGFDSSVVRPTFAYVAGGNTADTNASGSNIATNISINPQLPPDSSHQAVTLPTFNLPQGQNGLFHVNTDRSHPYLVETNPAFATLRGFLSSDYLLNIIGYNQDLTQRRLGDGLYEQRLVQEAIVARTGKRFLDGLASDEAQFKYLMDNAIASKTALNLVPGIALSAEQVAALTHDIVWMQEQQVNGQKVLVPVLYLAQANDRLAPTGALIQGSDVALISGSTLNNSGTLRASNTLSVSANSINNSGLMQANERLSLLATDSIRNAKGGIIAGKDVSAIALTGDIVNERSVTTHESAKKGFERREDFVDSAAGIEASNGLTLSAGRDIVNQGGNLKAGGNAELSAGRDLLIVSQSEMDVANNKSRKGYSNRDQTTQYSSGIEIGGDLSAKAGRDLAIVGSTVKAGGDVALQAVGDVTIASAANENHLDAYRKSGGKKVTRKEDHVQQVSSVIEAGGDLKIAAGNNLVVSASDLKAGNEAYLYAGNQLAVLSAENSDYSLYDKKAKGSWGTKEAKRDEVTDIRNIGSSITTGGDLTLESGSDQLYRKAKLDSGGDLVLDSGGAISFEAVKDKHQESHEESSSSWVWTSMENKGKVDETLRQSQLSAKGEVLIKAVEGLHIDVRQINKETVSQSIDAMVKADPSMAWLKEAEARGDVDWRQVKELHDKWSDSHSGLGGPAMIIIIIIVTYFTAGAASSLVGSAAGAAAGSGSAMAAAGTASASAVASGAAVGSTVAAGWANLAATAMLTSAAGTATVSTINNKGNVGNALKETFSSDNLKNYMVAGATAGLTAGVYNEWTGTQTGPAPAATNATNGAMANSGAVTVSNTAGGLSSLQGVGQFAANQALQNTTSAVLNKALGREGSLGDALQTSLVNTFAAYGFNLVGDIGKEYHLEPGGLEKIGLHAVMGGLASEAAGGDFRTGAIAAGVNEALVSHLAAQYELMPEEQRKSLLVMNSQLIGVLATAIQDPDADSEKLQTGSWVAQSSTQYNWLLHQEVEEADKARAACDGAGGDVLACKDNITRATDQLSKLRDQQMYEYGRALQEKAYLEGWTRQEYEAGINAYWGNIDQSQVVVGDPAAAQAGFISRETYAGAKDSASTLPSRVGDTLAHPLDVVSGVFEKLIGLPGAFTDWISSPIPAQSIERSLDDLATMSAANAGGLLFDSATGLLVAGVGGKLVSWVGGKWVEFEPTSRATPAGELPSGQVNVLPSTPVEGAKANVGSISHISGVNLPKSQSKMIADFEAAGYPTKPVVSPTSGNIVGTQYILPDGSRVRVMQADGRSPQRASFENANGGPVDPTTGKPPQPPQGLSKAERKQWIRERTHIEQVD